MTDPNSQSFEAHQDFRLPPFVSELPVDSHASLAEFSEPANSNDSLVADATHTEQLIEINDTELDVSQAQDAVDEALKKPSYLAKGARFAGQAALAGVATRVLWFEYSAENEVLRADKGLEALVQAKEWTEGIENRWVSTATSAAAVFGTVGGVTMAIEMTAGTITAYVQKKKDGLLKYVNSGLNWMANQVETTDKDGKPIGDVAIALAGGTAPLVVKKNNEVDGDRTFKDSMGTVTKGSAGIAAFSGGVGSGYVVAAETADIHGQPELAMNMLDFISNDKTWWGLFGGMVAWGALKKPLKNTTHRIGAWMDSRSAAVDRAVEQAEIADANPQVEGVA